MIFTDSNISLKMRWCRLVKYMASQKYEVITPHFISLPAKALEFMHISLNDLKVGKIGIEP